MNSLSQPVTVRAHARNPEVVVPIGTPLMEAFFASRVLERLSTSVPALDEVDARRLGIALSMECLDQHGTEEQVQAGLRHARQAFACCDASVQAYGEDAVVYDFVAYRASRAARAS